LEKIAYIGGGQREPVITRRRAPGEFLLSAGCAGSFMQATLGGDV
jgi:hypothetical protein